MADRQRRQRSEILFPAHHVQEQRWRDLQEVAERFDAGEAAAVEDRQGNGGALGAVLASVSMPRRMSCAAFATNTRRTLEKFSTDVSERGRPPPVPEPS